MATTTDVYKLVVETDEALSKINNLAKGVAAAFTGMFAVVAAFGDEISDTAAAFNATTAEVIALSGALAAVGGKGDNAVKIFKGINDSIAELNDGNLKTLKNFQDLGFSISQLGSMSEAAIRETVIKNLAEMENATERNALAFKMFGKAAIGVDFGKLAQEIKDNSAEAEKYAQAIEDAGNAYDSMAKMLKQIKMAFADAFNPVFKILADTKVSTDAIATGFKVIAIAVTAVLVPLGLMRTAITVATAAQAAFNTVAAMNPWIRAGLIVASAITAAGVALGLMKDDQSAVNDETKKQGDATANNAVKTAELNNKLKQQREEIMKIVTEYKNATYALREQYNLASQALMMNKTQAAITASNLAIEAKLRADINAKKLEFNSKDLDYQAQNMQTYLKSIQAITQEAEEQKKITAEKIRQDEFNKDIEGSLIAQGNASADMLKELISIRGQYAASMTDATTKLQIDQATAQEMAEISNLQKAINDSSKLNTMEKATALNLLGTERKTQEEIAQLSALTNKLGEDANQLLDTQAEKMRVLHREASLINEDSRTFGAGWTQAFNSYAENATNASKIAGNAFNSVTRGMESAIDKFVETGKFSMGDFASSVIKDLIKIEMKAQAMQLWKMMGGGGGGGIGSMLGGLLGFAEGGTPPVGRPSIVGENGPELFVPKSSGTIIPNNQLSGGGAAGAAAGQQVTNNTYITNQVSALDAKGVAQLLQENKRMLFGIVESARREMPV